MMEFWNSLPPGMHVLGWCIGGTAFLVALGGAIYCFVSKPLANAVGVDEHEHGR
jgi:hypothetical protein